jgi:hypothetical protein
MAYLDQQLLVKYRLTVLAVLAAADNHVEEVNKHMDEWSSAGWSILNVTVRHDGVHHLLAETRAREGSG